MPGTLLVLTGGSGAGKTTLAAGIQQMHLQNLKVLFFDSIGIPAAELDAFGTGHQPGGVWQRQATMDWMDRIAGMLRAGDSVLFEGQMRIAFIQEAIAASRIANARILLIDCADDCRISRLTDRGQAHLANPDMMNWSQYLRAESREMGCEILDTGVLTLAECLARLKACL